MSIRDIPFIVFSINFLIILFVIATIPSYLSAQIPWFTPLAIWSLISMICMILLAHWVSKDEKTQTDLYEALYTLEEALNQRLDSLEEKQDKSKKVMRKALSDVKKKFFENM